MRILTIVAVALLALLPDCLACLVCGMEGGPCAAVADSCCDGAGCPVPADGASGDTPCTCGSACFEGCRDRDPAPAAGGPATPVPAPAAAVLGLADPADAATLPRPVPAHRSAGPPVRLPLRI